MTSNLTDQDLVNIYHGRPLGTDSHANPTFVKGLRRLEATFAPAADEPAEDDAEIEAPRGPKYPEVVVQLSGQDGNTFIIVSRVRSAITKYLQREMKHSYSEADTIGSLFFDEALAADANHAIATCMKWVTVR